MLNTVIIVIDVIAALFLILTILLHSGRGSGLSDMFGGTSSLAGGTALERTLDKLTVVSGVIFGLCTFWLVLEVEPVGRHHAVGRIARPRRSGGIW